MRMFLITALAGALVAGAASAPALAQYRSLPGGSWQASCRNSYVRGNVLTASCRADNGSYRRSSYNLGNCRGGQLGNSNGRLFCESSRNGRGYGYGYRGNGNRGNYAGLPAGSWQGSCNNARMNGSILTASCSNGHGYQRTSLDVQQCRSRSVGNSNGTLFCERR